MRVKRVSIPAIALLTIFISILLVFGYKFRKDISGVIRFPAIPGISRDTGPVFSGTLTRIDRDLHLFRSGVDTGAEGFVPVQTYYEAGVFLNGKYRGYKRIIAIREPLGPGNAVVYILATKDNNEYVLHEEDDASRRYPDTDWRSPFSNLDRGKVRKVDNLPSEHPQTIPLPDSFVLYKEAVVTDNIRSEKKNPEGFDIYEYTVRTDFSAYEPLQVSSSPLTFFAVINPPVVISQEWEEDARVQAQLREKYIKGSTKTIVLDSTGLPFSYTLSRTDEVNAYGKLLDEYRKAERAYEEARARFERKELPELPDPPVEPKLPNLRMTKNDIPVKTELFDTYDIAVPYICGIDVDTPVLREIRETDLTPLGRALGRELFIFKDPEHPFYKLAYRNKMLLSDEEFNMINGSRPWIPYEEYVARHPILLFKDPWGRWIALGEYDYKMIGGCGKPVLYLYPPRTTDVSVSFPKPMELTLSIPSYRTGWQVRAYPDGSIEDRRHDPNACGDIDADRSGSAYAADACVRNRYPYLYWEGNRVGAAFPADSSTGWIVGTADLEGFLECTLGDAGLSERERGDFLEFWVPRMHASGAPYFRVRFLTSADLNPFLPVAIDPKPDTYYRLFLDWQPLSDAGKSEMTPQILPILRRQGFTVVEWGGLLRPEPR